jgi:hypothetical protein
VSASRPRRTRPDARASMEPKLALPDDGPSALTVVGVSLDVNDGPGAEQGGEGGSRGEAEERMDRS